MGLLYYLIKSFAKQIASVYFRKIFVVGSNNIPNEGPIIICGNHSNQYVDPMLILTSCEREISFAMAASSYSKPVVGTFARMLKVIPVQRPEDAKKKGSGKVFFTSCQEIQGKETKFREESALLRDGVASVLITNCIFAIDKIIDNEKILVKANKEDFEKLKHGEHEYFFIPKIDNSRLFNEARQRLGEKGCICIFPEGTSHDRTDLIKLKAGIALMALGAMSEHITQSINIIPVGLNYFKREEFRSEVIIEFGQPFEVSGDWVEQFKTKRKETIEKLLHEIEVRMKYVTLRAPSFTELRSILLLRKLYAPLNARLEPTQYSELCKKFVFGYDMLKDLPETQVLLKRVNKYIEELESTGLGDHEVRNLNFSYSWFVRKTLFSVLLFHFYLILSLPAILIAFPFIYFVKKKAEYERLTAKAKNPNKIEALDVVSSVKIQYSLMLIPVIFLVWCTLFGYLFNTYVYLTCSIWTTVFIASIIFPVYSYISCRMADQLFFSFEGMTSICMYLLYPKFIKKLRLTREQLSNEILNFVNSHIHEVDTKWAEKRIDFSMPYQGDTFREIETMLTQ